MIRIIETFTSVQGETSFTGLPTFFIRLAACNLRCSWCDTPYSFVRGESITLDQIFEELDRSRVQHVCVTGGEPLLQEGVYPLMERLVEEGYTISLETGGSLPIARVPEEVHIILDIKCPGSGMQEKNRWDNLHLIRSKDEVKFVVADREDFEYALRVIEEHNLQKKAGTLLFSPVWDQLESHELTEWILNDAPYARLNLQIHKFIWDPATKGV